MTEENGNGKTEKRLEKLEKKISNLKKPRKAKGSKKLKKLNIPLKKYLIGKRITVRLGG